jgi:hypothetical protein
VEVKKSINLDNNDVRDLLNLPRFNGKTFSYAVRELVADAINGSHPKAPHISSPNGFIRILEHAFHWVANDIISDANSLTIIVRDFRRWLLIDRHALRLARRIRENKTTRIGIFCADQNDHNDALRSVSILLEKISLEELKESEASGQLTFILSDQVQPIKPTYDFFVMLWDDHVAFSHFAIVPTTQGYYYTRPSNDSFCMVTAYEYVADRVFSSSELEHASALTAYLNALSVPLKALL